MHKMVGGHFLLSRSGYVKVINHRDTHKIVQHRNDIQYSYSSHNSIIK